MIDILFLVSKILELSSLHVSKIAIAMVCALIHTLRFELRQSPDRLNLCNDLNDNCNNS